MTVRRGNLFWGILLVLAGGVPLVVRSGAVDPSVVENVWRLWPIALIVAGLSLIFFRRLDRTASVVVGALVLGLFVGGVLAGGGINGIGCSDAGASASQLSRSGTFDAPAAVRLQLNCGSVTVGVADGDGWTFDARYSGGEPQIDSGAGSLAIESQGGGPFDNRQTWTLGIPATGVASLSETINAGSSTNDLGEAQLETLDLQANAGQLIVRAGEATIGKLSATVNAGSISITLGEHALDGALSSNAGSIDLCVPDGIGLSVTVGDNITFSHNLDERGLSQSGTTWSRPASGGGPTITLDVSGNASSFDLDPDEGCA